MKADAASHPRPRYIRGHRVTRSCAQMFVRAVADSLKAGGKAKIILCSLYYTVYCVTCFSFTYKPSGNINSTCMEHDKF
jgi:hypothetical protein